MAKLEQAKRLTWIQSVLEQYEGPLTGYAARITGNADSARDVVQEVFLRLCRQEQAELNGRLAPWLYAVCRNHALDVVRKNGRVKPLGETDRMDAADRDPATVVEAREGSGRIAELIQRLPDNQQDVIHLRFQHGLSYKEIAEVTKLSVSNVGYLMHTGLKALRDALHVGDRSEPRP